jgi:hypothetical protein
MLLIVRMKQLRARLTSGATMCPIELQIVGQEYKSLMREVENEIATLGEEWKLLNLEIAKVFRD